MLKHSVCLLLALLAGCAGSEPNSPGRAQPTMQDTACKNAQLRFQTMCASQGLPRNMATLTPSCLIANDDVHRYCD
jgi:hypothetical protein